jgi:hypothetical protein
MLGDEDVVSAAQDQELALQFVNSKPNSREELQC